MPIFPCFDPTTGASGGASGGDPASLYDVSMETVDLTDGTWYLEDDLGFIDSVSFSGGYNTITMNAKSGSSSYRWDNSATNNFAPRWHKELFIGTTRITSDDLLTHTNVIEVDQTIREFNWTLCAGVCVNPTTTTRNQIDGMGAGATLNPSESNARYGHWRNTSMPVAFNASTRKVVQVGQYGTRFMGTTCYMALSSANVHLQRGFAGGAEGLGIAVPLHAIIGLGTRTNTSTIAAGNRVKVRISQSAIKWKLP